MSEVSQGMLALLGLLLAAAVGAAVRPLLREAHRTQETMEVIQMVVAMLVTLAAIVLGLVTTSVKSSFDELGADVRAFSVALIQLDTALRSYGPETDAIRAIMRDYTGGAIRSTWEYEPPPPGARMPIPPRGKYDDRLENSGLGALLTRAESDLRELPRDTSTHAAMGPLCLARLLRVEQLRWIIIEHAHSSLSTPFCVILALWLAIIFLCFGLVAPRNLLTYAIILLGAVSIASAIFVVLDLDTPFTGLFVVPSEPLREAFARMQV